MEVSSLAAQARSVSGASICNIYGTFQVTRSDDLPNGDPAFYAFLDLEQRNSQPGLLLDSDGLHLQPMRLHYEEQAWKDKERAAGRIVDSDDNGGETR